MTPLNVGDNVECDFGIEKWFSGKVTYVGKDNYAEIRALFCSTTARLSNKGHSAWDLDGNFYCPCRQRDGHWWLDGSNANQWRSLMKKASPVSPLDQIAVEAETEEASKAVGNRFEALGFPNILGYAHCSGAIWGVKDGRLEWNPKTGRRISAADFLRDYPAPAQGQVALEACYPYLKNWKPGERVQFITGAEGEIMRVKECHDWSDKDFWEDRRKDPCSIPVRFDVIRSGHHCWGVSEKLLARLTAPSKPEPHVYDEPAKYSRSLGSSYCVDVAPPMLTDTQIRALTDEADAKRRKMTRREFLEELRQGGYVRPARKPWAGDGPFSR